MKRLCVVVPSHWSGGAGGAELQVKTLLQRLGAHGGFDVHYLTRYSDPNFRPEGYTLHRVPAHVAPGDYFLFDVPSVVSALKHIRPQVIYQRVASAYTGAAAYYARRNASRLVWHVSSDRDVSRIAWRPTLRSPLEQLNKRLIEYGARRADAIIVQNKGQAELLHRNYGRADAIPIANFHALPTTPSVKAVRPLLICWVANVKTIKQPEIFLRLVSDFSAHPEVQFVMAGAVQMGAKHWGPLSAAIRAQKNLSYVGQLSAEQVNELLSRAHLLVNTSAFEGFPNTFIQSWLRDVAIVSLCVNPDGVFDGELCGICGHGSYEAFSAAVTRLIADQTLREAIAKRASALARERFTESNADRIIEVLERITE